MFYLYKNSFKNLLILYVWVFLLFKTCAWKPPTTICALTEVKTKQYSTSAMNYTGAGI